MRKINLMKKSKIILGVTLMFNYTLYFSQLAGNAIYDNVNVNKKTVTKVNTQISNDNSILLEANVI